MPVLRTYCLPWSVLILDHGVVISRKSCDEKKAGFAVGCDGERGVEKVASGASALTWPSLLKALDNSCGEGFTVLELTCYLISFSKWGSHTPSTLMKAHPVSRLMIVCFRCLPWYRCFPIFGLCSRMRKAKMLVQWLKGLSWDSLPET